MIVWGKGTCLNNQSNCRLAMMELKMLLAAIILQFDVEWADKLQDPLADIWSQIDPMHLRLRRRVIPT
jgi:cytochrome P450